MNTCKNLLIKIQHLFNRRKETLSLLGAGADRDWTLLLIIATFLFIVFFITGSFFSASLEQSVGDIFNQPTSVTAGRYVKDKKAIEAVGAYYAQRKASFDALRATHPRFVDPSR